MCELYYHLTDYEKIKNVGDEAKIKSQSTIYECFWIKVNIDMN